MRTFHQDLWLDCPGAMAGEMVAAKLRLTLPQDIWKQWAGKPMILWNCALGDRPLAVKA
ncbi:MAG: hypothetical protein SNJ57_10565 [Cyanobacteriota bacterium]